MRMSVWRSRRRGSVLRMGCGSGWILEEHGRIVGAAENDITPLPRAVTSIKRYTRNWNCLNPSHASNSKTKQKQSKKSINTCVESYVCWAVRLRVECGNITLWQLLEIETHRKDPLVRVTLNDTSDPL